MWVIVDVQWQQVGYQGCEGQVGCIQQVQQLVVQVVIVFGCGVLQQWCLGQFEDVVLLLWLGCMWVQVVQVQYQGDVDYWGEDYVLG